MVLAALGVADDHVGSAEIGQHLGRDVARERPRFLRVAVLPANADARAEGGTGEGVDEGRRRADEELDLALQSRRVAVANLGEHLRRGHAAVHLPVAGDQAGRPIDAHVAPPERRAMPRAEAGETKKSRADSMI
jgi:hypothetical protein